MKTLKEAWQKKFLNIHRIRKEATGYYRWNHLDEEDLNNANWEFILVYFINHFLEVQGRSERVHWTTTTTWTDTSATMSDYIHVKLNQPENKTMKDKKVESKQFFGNQNLDDMSDDGIFDLIRDQKDIIKNVEDVMETKAAQKIVAAAEKNIKDLVNYLDKRK